MGKKEGLEKLVNSIINAKTDPTLGFEYVSVKKPELQGKKVSVLIDGYFPGFDPNCWVVVPSYSNQSQLILVWYKDLENKDEKALETFFDFSLVRKPKEFAEQTFTLKDVLDYINAKGYKPASTSN